MLGLGVDTAPTIVQTGELPVAPGAMILAQGSMPTAINYDSPMAVITRLLTIYCLPLAAVAWIVPRTVTDQAMKVVENNCGSRNNWQLSGDGKSIPCPLIWGAVAATALYYGIYKLMSGSSKT